MHPVFRWTLALAAVGAVAGWIVTSPDSLDGEALNALASAPAEVSDGERIFWASGCASCHIAPGAEEGDAPILAGGQAFATAFGTFYAPNISASSEAGIGDWTREEFATAVQKGVSPEGSHYYPAFPYAAYAKARPEDVAALYEFMKTLPEDATPSKPHDVGFPFNIRRSIGGWKLLFGQSDWVVDQPENDVVAHGRYMVEALAHCGECHTPRNPLGGLEYSQWLAGGPNPNGKGKIPGITPAQLDWSDEDVFYYLTTGFTPDFDSAGGHMTSVVSNLARLPEEDVRAIVAYLKALP